MRNTGAAGVQRFEPAENPKPATGSIEKRILVIGSGPVGVRFAQQILKRNPLASVLVFGNEPFQPYNRVQLTALLAGEVSREQIDIPLPAPETHPNFEFKIAAIRKVDPENRILVDANNQEYSYDTLVFATGARAHVPNIPGNNLKGVYSFRSLTDTENLYSRLARSRSVVVVGGGLLGLEAAKGMLKANTRVTLVQQGPHLMNRQLDSRAAEILKKKVESLGIQVITNSGVREVIGETRVEAVRTNDNIAIPCDTLLVCAGIRPNMELARESGLAVKTGIVVSSSLQTSDTNIYAVGECCEFDGVTYGVVNPGFEQAAVAADVISGGSARYSGSLFASSLKVVGEQVTSMGEVNELPERPFQSELYYANEDRGCNRKIVFHRGRIIGAAAIGDWPEQHRIQEAFRNRRYFWPWQRLMFSFTGRLWISDQSSSIADWPESAVVCQCNSVTLGTLAETINRGAVSTEALQEQTGAGTVCGSCKPLLQQLVGEGALREREKGWLPLVAGSLISAVIVAAIMLMPASQTAQSFGERNWFELVWNDKFWKQVTGFSLLGLSALGLLLSLRKRLKFEWMGQVAWWRLFHSILGLACATILVFHTGFNPGDNLNRLLLVDFLGVLLLGSMAGAVIAMSHHLAPVKARSTRKLWSWLHLLFTWPLPALLAAHIISVYYF